MSGPIRKLLRLTKARLQGYLQDSKLISICFINRRKFGQREKEYAWAIEGEGGKIELQLDAREVIARLQARLNRILRAQERSGRRPASNSSLNESRRQ